MIELAGHRIAIRHLLYEGGKMTKEGRTYLEREQPAICIFGHTHQPKAEWFGKTLLFNPGSAGPKRFKLPRGIGLIRLFETKVSAHHIALPDKASSHMIMSMMGIMFLARIIGSVMYSSG